MSKKDLKKDYLDSKKIKNNLIKKFTISGSYLSVMLNKSKACSRHFSSES